MVRTSGHVRVSEKYVDGKCLAVSSKISCQRSVMLAKPRSNSSETVMERIAELINEWMGGDLRNDARLRHSAALCFSPVLMLR